MVGFLIASAGGIFVLVNSNGEKAEIPKETLVAGIAVQEEEVLESAQEDTEKAEEGVFEVKLQTLPTAQPAPKPAPLPKPVPIPPPASTQAPPPASKVQSVPPPSPVPPPAPEPTLVFTPVAEPPFPLSTGKININTAGYEELQKITGVGEVIAQRIIDYRSANGFFQRIEDIKNVNGIADVKFEKMKDEITVGDQPPSPAPVPVSQPSPEPQPSDHTFYTSSYRSSKLYYCDTDPAWKNLSEKYLESYLSEEAVLAKYPEKTLHEPCK